MLIVHPCVCDELTPSSGSRPGSDDPATTGSTSIEFSEAAKQLTAVFPVQLDRFEQVMQNSYNWSGPQDASLYCEIGFTPEAILISGKVADNVPFVQTRERPQMPDWWRISYGADGIQFRFDDPTSASRSLHFILNLGSAGTNPRVELFASPMGKKTGFLADAGLEILGVSKAPNRQEPKEISSLNGFRFQAVIPTSDLAEPQFFAGPLRVSVRLHDVDSGKFAGYTMLEERLEKTQ